MVTEVSVFCSEMISLKEESSSVQSLKDEFTQRIADAERKAQLACKERDIAKKVLMCPLKAFHLTSKPVGFCLSHVVS